MSVLTKMILGIFLIVGIAILAVSAPKMIQTEIKDNSKSYAQSVLNKVLDSQPQIVGD